MLKFSPANAKLQQLYKVNSIRQFLGGKRKVYSLDLLSGHSCPYAKECLSKATQVDDKIKIVDGPDTKYRCFSATQEVVFPAVYRLRKHNFDILRKLSYDDMVQTISDSLPKNLGVCRIHVGGDLFNNDYFLAWCEVAKNNPDKLFYAYTKSLPFWIRNKQLVDSMYNFVLTASFGGRYDETISIHRLRYSRVVFNEEEAYKLGLEIDHDDSHAADPDNKYKPFALLLHGVQPAGSEAAKAIKVLKDKNIKFSYARGGKHSVV